ncbi:MAG: 50S ribosomal protein L3 [Bifidobacteriaceae bacterium]|jgi:large subunit ribosomal protein L3|nr:50S ribosomal protein L3 [Bifidobacteriaceae bacterium]
MPRISQKDNPKAILGTKVGMSQIWDEQGHFTAVSVIKIEDNVATQIKTVEKEGYNAVQFATVDIEERKVSKPILGHFEKAGISPKRYVFEVTTNNASEYKIGQTIGVDLFKAGDIVDVTGTSKGKGFAGVMKRHGFKGVSASHGAHKNHRKPGSVGACATPGRVFKGLRMAGRMGGDKTTVQSLQVESVNAEKGYILIKGSVPGPKGGLILLKSAVKDKNKED